jgi:serine/threonine-protein kinase ULK/ATG1
VERLTFEEFFHHPFLSDKQSYDFTRSRLDSRTMNDFHSSGSSPSRNIEEISQEDGLPFFLDDDSSGPEGSPSSFKHTSPMKSSYGFSVERREAALSPLKNMDLSSRYSRVSHRAETNNFKFEGHRLSDRSQFKPSSLPDSRSFSTQGRGNQISIICLAHKTKIVFGKDASRSF